MRPTAPPPPAPQAPAARLLAGRMAWRAATDPAAEEPILRRLLQEAPDAYWPRECLAQLLAARGDWPALASLAAHMLRLAPDFPAGHRAAIQAALRANRADAAAASFATARARFPDAAWLLNLEAEAALPHAAAWPQAALALAERAIAVAEAEAGWRLALAALRAQADWATLATTQAAAEARFPHARWHATERAETAAARADWPATLAAAEAALAAGLHDHQTGLLYVCALRALGRHVELARFADAHLADRPRHKRLIAEAARAAAEAGDPNRALALWARHRALAPELPEGFAEPADLLTALGRAADAATLRAACPPPPAAPPPPITPAGWQGPYPTPGPAQAPTTLLAPDASDWARFVSLGGAPLGCEFGMFRRALAGDAEGLLTWAGIRPDQLALALAEGFSGVGTAAQTMLDADRGEYHARDYRYGFGLHTGLALDALQPDTALPRILKVLAMRRRLLLDHLTEPDRIFVFKVAGPPLAPALAWRLMHAVAAHGPGTLLLVSMAGPEHPAGTIRRLGPRLFAGALAFEGTVKPPAPPVLDRHGWLAVCSGVVETVEREGQELCSWTSLGP